MPVTGFNFIVVSLYFRPAPFRRDYFPVTPPSVSFCVQQTGLKSAANGGDTSAGIMMFCLLWSLGYSAKNYRIAPVEQVKGYSHQLMQNYILLGRIN